MSYFVDCLLESTRQKNHKPRCPSRDPARRSPNAASDGACGRGPRPSDRYLPTVRGDTRSPSLSRSSSAMRASPQMGFSAAILRISSRRSRGRQRRPRGDFHLQNRRKPFWCHRMKVSGLTTRSALRHSKSLPRVNRTSRTPSVARCGCALRSSKSASCLRRKRFRQPMQRGTGGIGQESVSGQPAPRGLS